MAYEIDLSGRVAFVTGASGGLGAQFARTLAQAGASVVYCELRRCRCSGGRCGVGQPKN